MHTRRSVVGTLAGGICLSLAGCTLFEGGIEKSARQAVVNDVALEVAGYSHERTEELSFDGTIDVADESREVRLTNWLTEYRKTPTDEAPNSSEGDGVAAGVEGALARFVLFATPTVSIAGRDVNPFDRLDEQRLLERMLEEADIEGIEDVEPVAEQDIDVLEETVTLTEYEGRTREEGLDLVLHLGDLTNEGDFVALLGVYPVGLDEADNVVTLAEGIDHPVENEK